MCISHRTRVLGWLPLFKGTVLQSGSPARRCLKQTSLSISSPFLTQFQSDMFIIIVWCHRSIFFWYIHYNIYFVLDCVITRSRLLRKKKENMAAHSKKFTGNHHVVVIDLGWEKGGVSRELIKFIKTAVMHKTGAMTTQHFCPDALAAGYVYVHTWFCHITQTQ